MRAPLVLASEPPGGCNLAGQWDSSTYLTRLLITECVGLAEFQLHMRGSRYKTCTIGDHQLYVTRR